MADSCHAGGGTAMITAYYTNERKCLQVLVVVGTIASIVREKAMARIFAR
jgi:hypothetical protein